MPANGSQHFFIINIIFYFCQHGSNLRMKHERIVPLQLSDLQPILLRQLQFLCIWYTFRTVMHQSCQHGTLHVILITHRQCSTGIHDAQGMLISAVVHLTFQILFQVLNTNCVHENTPSYVLIPFHTDDGCGYTLPLLQEASEKYPLLRRSFREYRLRQSPYPAYSESGCQHHIFLSTF